MCWVDQPTDSLHAYQSVKHILVIRRSNRRTYRNIYVNVWDETGAAWGLQQICLQDLNENDYFLSQLAQKLGGSEKNPHIPGVSGHCHPIFLPRRFAGACLNTYIQHFPTIFLWLILANWVTLFSLRPRSQSVWEHGWPVMKRRNWRVKRKKAYLSLFSDCRHPCIVAHSVDRFSEWAEFKISTKKFRSGKWIDILGITEIHSYCIAVTTIYSFGLWFRRHKFKGIGKTILKSLFEFFHSRSYTPSTLRK